jgi:hypothetical protein
VVAGREVKDKKRWGLPRKHPALMAMGLRECRERGSALKRQLIVMLSIQLGRSFKLLHNQPLM